MSMRRGPETLGMFGGHVPSRGALRVVQSAIEIGIDPSRYVDATVRHTEARGKQKIIVKPGSPLGALRNAVMSKQAMGK